MDRIMRRERKVERQEVNTGYVMEIQGVEEVKVESIKKFFWKDTALLKTIRTLLEAFAAWGILALTQLLAGTVFPLEVQAAIVGFGTALLAAVIAYIGQFANKRKEDANGWGTISVG